MNKKIFIYLFTMNSKYILLNIFFVCLFVQFINLLEISRIIEEKNSNIFSILYLSCLKIPTIFNEVISFVIVISTAFVYRNLIKNNELISLRNLGYSIIDIFKPIGLSIFIFGLFFLLVFNPLSSKFEKIFDSITTKDFSDMYSIRIKNNELWIKNITNTKDNYFINISNIDLENMFAENIRIIKTTDKNNYLYIAKKGKLIDKKFDLKDVIIFNIDNDNYQKIDTFGLDLNFDRNNLIDSISNYKFIPFYKYNEHLNSLKKFNLYSTEISLYYLSEVLKPIFLIVIGFIVMGYAGTFKRNENFFKILFISILIGFVIFLLKETVTAITISSNISFWLAYLIIFLIPLIIGLYQTINIETN